MCLYSLNIYSYVCSRILWEWRWSIVYKCWKNRDNTCIYPSLNLKQCHVMAQISVEWAESDCSLVTIADTNVVDCVFQYTALRVCKVFEEPTTSEWSSWPSRSRTGNHCIVASVQFLRPVQQWQHYQHVVNRKCRSSAKGHSTAPVAASLWLWLSTVLGWLSGHQLWWYYRAHRMCCRSVCIQWCTTK